MRHRLSDSLSVLLQNLQPRLLPDDYVFCHLDQGRYGALAHRQPLASVAEEGGLSLVLSRTSADEEGLSYQGVFRCISLHVFSSLQAVGLTAAVSSELAKSNISANLIAGTHHDHLLVPEHKADQALEHLIALSAQAIRERKP